MENINSQVIDLSQYRQLALRRLKPFWKLRWRHLWRGLKLISLGLFRLIAWSIDGVELEEHVGPGQPPIRRPSWERRSRDIMRF
jgi:hypothetical protein